MRGRFNSHRYALWRVFYAACFFFILCVCGACGLEEYHDIEAPAAVLNLPVYNTEPLNRYYYFTTNDAGNVSSGDFVYAGTAVYYRIYNNLNTLNSHVAAIAALNSSSSASAANSLIESYGYKPLGFGAFVESSGKKAVSSRQAPDPLLDPALANRIVRIRLVDYSDEDKAGIRYGFTPQSLADLGIPLRYDGRKSFFFYDDDFSESQEPKNGDDDVEYGSFSAENTWYVNAYAFAVARDSSFIRSYSKVLHLGTIAIAESDP